MDHVPPREVLDEQCNAYGYPFIDCLVDCNLCMVNGRIGKNNYTCISGLGKSAVDYICAPHESRSLCKQFEVLTMSNLINKLQLYGQTKIPDHSLVNICLEFPFIDNVCNETKSGNTVKSVRYNLNEIPSSFLNDE